MVRSFNYKDKIWKNLTLKVIKFQMTKIIFFTSCQYNAVKMMREDIYSPIKTVSSLWPDFRLTCANVCFLFPPSFTTKLVHREKSDWIWLNHVWQETSQIHSIAKPLSHRRDSFWIFVISELHIVCLLYRNSIACLFALKNGIFFTRPI